MAPTQTAAALLVLGRAGLTVVLPGEEREALASLPVSLLADFDRVRLAPRGNGPQMGSLDLPIVGATATHPTKNSWTPPHVAEMEDVLPYFHSTLERASDAARAAHCCSGGWQHPRDSHVASKIGRPHSAVPHSVPRPASRTSHRASHSAPGTTRTALVEMQSLSDTLRRWGIKTFGALARLPAGDVYERLGARGIVWQRLARGEDAGPLVPWVPEDPFEGTLDLEWPIEGLEPLSFVLGRLLEPLADRLERADRGAAILHTHLRLVSKEVHARVLQLPAPMRDPKTLRTLMLLDLESNPPAAAIDRVRVLIEPTPGRVTQWLLFERAQPSPEQVSTLLARLAALMGEARVGSPRLLDSWKPGVFGMERFEVRDLQSRGSNGHPAPRDMNRTPSSALRRFRLPVPARVQMHEGRPIRVITDRRGVTGGAVVQAAGPWRTSGEWWNDYGGQAGGSAGRQVGQGQVEQLGQVGQAINKSSDPRHPHDLPTCRPADLPHATHWDRDEWDIAMADGTVYRLFVEREVGQWFIEGVVD
jgi:protein ImuB